MISVNFCHLYCNVILTSFFDHNFFAPMLNFLSILVLILFHGSGRKILIASVVAKLCGVKYYNIHTVAGIIGSVDSKYRDGPDTPIYIIHYKKRNNSEQENFKAF